VWKAVAPELKEAGGGERFLPSLSLISILVQVEFKSKYFNYFFHQIKLKYIYVSNTFWLAICRGIITH
jgi:hypothetical protein